MSDKGFYNNGCTAAAAVSGKKSKYRSGLAATILLVVEVALLLAIAGGVFRWIDARRFETIDDAFFDTNIANVAPRALGQVVAVPVTDNLPVKTDQLLAQLDNTSGGSQLAEAQAGTTTTNHQAQLLSARKRVQSLYAFGSLGPGIIHRRLDLPAGRG